MARTIFLIFLICTSILGYLVPSNLADEKYFNRSEDAHDEYKNFDISSKSEKPLISTIIIERLDDSQEPKRWISQIKEIKQIAVGKPAPRWKAEGVLNGNFTTLSSDDYKGNYYILVFYPGLFSYVCPTELIAFSDRIEEFRKINADVVTISTNAKFAHLTATKIPRKERGLGESKIPLLSDQSQKISRDFNILKGADIYGSFIIDGKGIIRQITINDQQVGRSVDEALRLIQGYQKTDEDEVMCPVDWHPGDECMKPNLEDSLKYYHEHY